MEMSDPATVIRKSVIWKELLARTIIGLSSLAFVAQLGAAPGDVDFSFDPGSGVDGPVSSIAVQSDGKILIGGNFTTVKDAVRNCIARLNADGSVDRSFDPGTGANGTVESVVVTGDGKVLIGGWFGSVNGVSRNRIARLNADGSLDSSFNPGTGASDRVNCVAVQADGKVLIGGAFTSVNGVSRGRMAGLNTDGSLDTNFTGTGCSGTVESIAVQADGKVLIGGAFGSVNGVNQSGIARLNADGSVDSSFDSGTGASGFVYSIALQPDGKVLIGGNFFSVNGINRVGIARLNADGSVDGGFDPGTGVAANSVRSVAVQSGDKVFIGGNFTSVNGVSRNRIARLNANGSLDSSFDPGTGASSSVESIAVQSDGTVLVGGNFTSVNDVGRSRIARLNADGSLDNGFNPGKGADSTVQSIALQPDGKMLIGGAFTSVNVVSRNRIARLNVDGSLDSTFDPGLGANGSVESISVESDGTVLVGGNFTSVNGVSRNRIARLNADGSPDSTFDPGMGASSTVRSVAVQSDGKVLIGGAFTSVNTVSRRRIARLNADGSLDSTFDPGTGASSSVESIAVQLDGKVLIGGLFLTVSDVSRNRIARLNIDGSLDSSFDAGPVASFVYSVATQQDGKVLIGGDFTLINEVDRVGIARLNADGTLDSSFDPGTGASGRVNSIVVQADGKALIAGAFTSVNGMTRWRIARLNTDGSLDGSFKPGAGANNTVASVAVQPDGKVLVGGSFTRFNGVPRGYVARLLSDAAVLVFGPMKDNGDFVARFEGTPGLTYTLEYRESLLLANWEKLINLTAPTTDLGLGIGVFELREAVVPTGQRFYRVVYPSH